jgi:hypothetical protein
MRIHNPARNLSKSRKVNFFHVVVSYYPGSSSMSLLKLLPFLPPVVVGIFVLFSAFWPQRILFFSAKQRRKFINGQFLQVSCFFLYLSVCASS